MTSTKGIPAIKIAFSSSMGMPKVKRHSDCLPNGVILYSHKITLVLVLSRKRSPTGRQMCHLKASFRNKDQKSGWFASGHKPGANFF